MASGPAFRLLGIPVRIDPTFFVIVAVLGFTGDLRFLLIWVPIVTVSVLVHELGHAVAFRAFGKQPHVLLQGMGGLTSATGTLPPSRELVVSLAGPLTGLVLIGLPALWLDARVADSASDLDTALRILVFVNIAWSIVNLMPVLPLDGGRVTESVLHVVTRRPADKATHVISVVVAGGAGLWAYGADQIFLAMFAAFFAVYNLAQLSHMRARSRSAQLGDAYRVLAGGDEDRALEVARQVTATSSAALPVAQALELQAWIALRREDPDEAENILRRMPPRNAPTAFFTACLALARGEHRWLDELTAAYIDSGQHGPWAIIAADLVARAGAVDPLVERLAGSGDTEGSTALTVLQSDLHHARRYEQAIGAGERAYALAVGSNAAPEAASAAYDVACSEARAGQPADAMTWLERAVANGFDDRALLERDPDLEPLRHTREFDTLREGLR